MTNASASSTVLATSLHSLGAKLLGGGVVELRPESVEDSESHGDVERAVMVAEEDVEDDEVEEMELWRERCHRLIMSSRVVACK